MSTKAARICACGRRVQAGARCQCRHAAEKQRPGARQRGYDSAWQQEAAAFLVSHPTCTCGKPAVLVRHRVSIRKRPDLRMDKSNWLPGCRSCNAKDLHHERTGGGREFSEARGGTAGVSNAGNSRFGPSFEKGTR